MEVGGVADAAPGFEADEGTAGFKGRPDAEGFGLGAIHSQNRSAVLVEEIHRSHLTALEQQGVVSERGIRNGESAFAKIGLRLIQGDPQPVFQLGVDQRHRFTSFAVVETEISMRRVVRVIVGQKEPWMRTDLEEHLPCPGIDDFPLRHKANVNQHRVEQFPYRHKGIGYVTGFQQHLDAVQCVTY